MNKNGVILQETENIVVIATGIEDNSANSKTGAMIQVYILHKTVSPLQAIATGADSAICGNCPHRGTIVNGKVIDRRCYVQVGKAPMGIWKCYQRGGYRRIDASEYAYIFGGRLVRFGAYGDPAFIDRAVVQGIANVARGWTAYTHQWRNAEYAWIKNYAMASCDTPQDTIDAANNGWRCFRVAPYQNGFKLTGEISCPASVEAGKRTTCDQCRLCNGATDSDRRKNIVIQDHSVIAKRSPLTLISIQAVA